MAARELLTIDEAAGLTRLSVNTLRYMRQRGEGPPSGKLGRRLFYDRELLESWVDAQFAAGETQKASA